jgi:ADP-ribosylglycohydrolase
VLGKIIGVFLGRPFENWSYERITHELGEINYYVHEKLGKRLIITDDDISGTFTFLRALPDYGNSRDITSQQIGQTWLNYIVENRSILWWGGLGKSTEHTAYLRLKSGITAPQSGSMATNGRVVAEQIGAQIFIDGCGLVAPGDPEFAAELARRFASVSHDSEAIYGAQVVAAMEAQAFVESDIGNLLDVGVSVIPKDSVIYRLINDLREWHSQESDWRKTREKIVANYGYDKYGGSCHMVPNHALIIHSLLYGEGNFQKSLMIVNTCGWDTDCNSGNIGCLLGVRGGLAALEAGPDWRSPLADRFYLPSADGGRGVTDALSEAYRITNIGRSLVGENEVAPKKGARFHFSMPGSLQGFQPEDSIESSGTVTIANSLDEAGEGRLAISYKGIAVGRVGRVATQTFPDPGAMSMKYQMQASPTLYPGQTVHAQLTADDTADAVTCRFYLRAYNEKDELRHFFGPSIQLEPSGTDTLIWHIDGDALGLHGFPIAEIGLEITSQQRAEGVIYMDYLTWDGEPDTVLSPHSYTSLRAWVNGVDKQLVKDNFYSLVQNTGRGLLIHGTREWTNYEVSAKIVARLVTSFGLAVRVQGMQRYYALLFSNHGKARLVKVLDGEHVLAETDFEWHVDISYDFVLQVKGTCIRAIINGDVLFDVTDVECVLGSGGLALVCEEGWIKVWDVVVRPLKL